MSMMVIMMVMIMLSTSASDSVVMRIESENTTQRNTLQHSRFRSTVKYVPIRTTIVDHVQGTFLHSENVPALDGSAVQTLCQSPETFQNCHKSKYLLRENEDGDDSRGSYCTYCIILYYSVLYKTRMII